jgi:GH25 family lysozyme M1 (1,4-beta-N-acetylmuramidase)
MRLLAALIVCAGCTAPRDLAVGHANQAATVCAAGATVDGIDVSHYQGTVDWASVYGSGRRFGIAKATEGTNYTDPDFAANWAAMKSAGVLRSAYHFFRSNDDAAAQAQYFLSVIGTLEAGDLPPMLDLETTDSQSAATVASKAMIWLQQVEAATGKKPILYTYVDFWQNQIAQPSGFDGYPLNIANYGVTCPDVVGSWTTWTMWQYSDAETVPGVSGGCDADHFNGDLAGLMQLGGGSGGPPPPPPPPPPPGDPCNGLTDGSYCGGDGITGDKNTLFVCKGGATASATVCPGGCKYNPPGTPDVCNAAPPPPPAADGGTSTPPPSSSPDGGTSGGGGGEGGGGVGGGGSDGTMPPAGDNGPPSMTPSTFTPSHGCTMGGSGGWESVALLLALFIMMRTWRRFSTSW